MTINTMSPSGFGLVVIFERSARAVVAREPPEIVDPSDSGTITKYMGKWCVFILSLLTPNLLRFAQRYYPIHFHNSFFFKIILILYFYGTISKMSYHFPLAPTGV